MHPGEIQIDSDQPALDQIIKSRNHWRPGGEDEGENNNKEEEPAPELAVYVCCGDENRFERMASTFVLKIHSENFGHVPIIKNGYVTDMPDIDLYTARTLPLPAVTSMMIQFMGDLPWIWPKNSWTAHSHYTADWKIVHDENGEAIEAIEVVDTKKEWVVQP